MQSCLSLTRLARLATMFFVLAMAVPCSEAQAEPQQPAPQQPVTQQPITPAQPVTQPQEPEGPFRELFVRPRRESGQTLTFSLSGYGGYDDNVIGDQSGPGADPRAQTGGSSLLGGDAALQYVKLAHRASFAANLGGSYHYFPSKSSLSTSGLSAGVGLAYQLGHRTRLRVDEGFSYQPYYQLGLFPGLGEPDLGAPVPSNLDFVVLKRQSILTTSTASLEQQLSRRSTLTFDGQFFSQTLDQPANSPTTGATTGTGTTTSTGGTDNVNGYTAGIHFKRQLTRYLSLRLGDEYRHFVYPAPTHRVLQGNNIDAGVDYSRSLPFSRHTSLSFTTGSAIVSIDGRRYGNVTGSASLVHLFSRNWQGSLSYNRDMSFVQTLSQPLFGDSASAAIQGIMYRKLLLSVSGGYMSGRLGYSRAEQDSSTLRTGTGALTLAYAITNALRANFSYTYFSYNFSSAALLPVGLQPSFDRNSVRGGLSLVLPLIR
jgi:hypothetical protein